MNDLDASNHLVEKLQRREQILHQAYEIAGNNGIENLHARTIGRALGVNHAAVHYYFSTRKDLLIALASYAHSRFVGDLERLQAGQQTGRQRLETHIALYEAYAKPTSRFFRVMSSMFVAAAEFDEIKKQLNAMVKDQAEKLERDLTAAKEERAIKSDSVFAHADTLSAFLMGLCYRSQIGGIDDPTAAVDQVFASLFN